MINIKTNKDRNKCDCKDTDTYYAVTMNDYPEVNIKFDNKEEVEKFQNNIYEIKCENIPLGELEILDLFTKYNINILGERMTGDNEKIYCIHYESDINNLSSLFFMNGYTKIEE